MLFVGNACRPDPLLGRHMPVKLKESQSLANDVEGILSRYPYKEAALVPVLHRLQREIGWLSPEAIEFAAEKLELPKPRVWGVASFYSMFRRSPPGRHLIEICTNISCSLLGAEHLRDHLSRRLGVRPGETTADGAFSLAEVECLGSCGTAPAMLVDGEYHENLTPRKIDDLLERLRAQDREAGRV